MNFIPTTYIYPIASPLELSQSLGFTLDNPRTSEEVEIIRRYLDVSMNSPDEMYEHEYYGRIPIDIQEHIVTIQGALEDFEKQHTEGDEYLRRFFNSMI